MPRSTAQVRTNLRSGRWLLPWLSLLLVSTSLAYAMNGTVTGLWAVREPQRQELARTGLTASVPAVEASAEGNDAPALGRSCVSLFGSYNSWLFDRGRRGVCRLGPDGLPGTSPGS